MHMSCAYDVELIVLITIITDDHAACILMYVYTALHTACIRMWASNTKRYRRMCVYGGNKRFTSLFVCVNALDNSTPPGLNCLDWFSRKRGFVMLQRGEDTSGHDKS